MEAKNLRGEIPLSTRFPSSAVTAFHASASDSAASGFSRLSTLVCFSQTRVSKQFVRHTGEFASLCTSFRHVVSVREC